MAGQCPLFVDIFCFQSLFCGNIVVANQEKLLENLLNRPSAVQGSGEAIPVFHRRVSPGNSKLTESLCSGCNAFVAASVNPKLLDLVERSHTCSGSRKNGDKAG